METPPKKLLCLSGTYTCTAFLKLKGERSGTVFKQLPHLESYGQICPELTINIDYIVQSTQPRSRYSSNMIGWFSMSPLPRLHHHDIMTIVELFFIYVLFATIGRIMCVSAVVNSVLQPNGRGTVLQLGLETGNGIFPFFFLSVFKV